MIRCFSSTLLFLLFEISNIKIKTEKWTVFRSFETDSTAFVTDFNLFRQNMSETAFAYLRAREITYNQFANYCSWILNTIGWVQNRHMQVTKNPAENGPTWTCACTI